MEPPSNFALVEKRIRALSTILYAMHHHHSPSSDPKQVPSFLRHLVNLFSSGDKHSLDAKKVIAVTGAIFHDGISERVQILAVTQNPYPRSRLTELNLEKVSRSQKTFQDIVDRCEYRP